MKLADAAQHFLTARRIAVTGVSRDAAKGHGSNLVFDRLIDRGYEAFPINPNAESIAGVTAYPDVTSVPGGVDAIVIGTRPERAMATMQEAVELGITKVWMHRSIDAGSVSPEAATYGREHGVMVIEGGCPLMFDPTADGAHKVMCRMLQLFGKVPRTV